MDRKRRGFHRMYSNEAQQVLLDSHVRAFEHSEGRQRVGREDVTYLESDLFQWRPAGPYQWCSSPSGLTRASAPPRRVLVAGANLPGPSRRVFLVDDRDAQVGVRIR